MFDVLGELMVSSYAVQRVCLHTGIVLVGTAGTVFTLARIREYKHCRRLLTEEINELYSVSLLRRGFLFTTRTSLVMARLIETMATTRSRWYVLHLVVRSLRRTPVKELFLDAMHVNTVRPLSGLEWIKALFTSAF